MDIMAHLTTDGRPDYSLIAEFYCKHWCEHYHPGLLAMLNRLLLTRLAPGARVFDVCCGTGTVARSLVRRGFRVPGVTIVDHRIGSMILAGASAVDCTGARGERRRRSPLSLAIEDSALIAYCHTAALAPNRDGWTGDRFPCK